MKELVISVEHIDETGKFYAESPIKRRAITVQDNETIHDAIRRVVEDKDFCVFSYQGKPQGNIYSDIDGVARVVGYHYRTKHYIEDRSNNISRENVPFTTWVHIHGELISLPLQEINS